MSFTFGFGGTGSEAAEPEPAPRAPPARTAARAGGIICPVALPTPQQLAAMVGGAEWEAVAAGPAMRLRKRVLPSAQVDAPYSSELRASDLLPGVYEGGFKLWECAVDLAGFLAELPDAELGPAHRVLELGCGHGLPGLVALRRGAQVDFVDYNVEVLQQLTIPNAVAAEADQQGADALGDLERVLGALAGRARFFSGDWCGLLGGESPAHAAYDVILTSDTLYTEVRAPSATLGALRSVTHVTWQGCVGDLVRIIPQLLA